MFSGYHEEAYWQAHVEDYLRWYTAGWKVSGSCLSPGLPQARQVACGGRRGKVAGYPHNTTFNL
jgi:hypothetical protein